MERSRKAVDKDELSRLQDMYHKVVLSTPQLDKRSIRCPECGQKIAIASNLRLMNFAIESHVEFHRSQHQPHVFVGQAKVINVRLALVRQVLFTLDVG